MTTDELLILDGTVMVLRPYFVGVDAPWAVARSALRRADGESSHLAVVIDRTMDTFRRQLDPRYKAHRPPAPLDLIAHFDRFEAEVTAMGVALFGSLTYEADDLAATLARQASAAGLGVCIRSNDKDLFQLVCDAPRVVTEDDKRGIRYDEAAVEAKLGVRPGQIVDYLSLVGDASDGVPGVKGVGAKTAATLLQHLGSLDAIFANLDAVAGLPIRGARSLGGKLAAGREDAMHARRLIKLVDDVDLGDDPLGRCVRSG
jgi:DNA polymerase-1